MADFSFSPLRYTAPMRSDDLPREQLDRLRLRLRPSLGYLSRLKTRMERRGFSVHDKMFALVLKSHAAMQELVMEIHYLACDSGVARRRKRRR